MGKFKNFIVRFFQDKRVRFLIVGGLNTVVGIGVTWIVYVCFGVSIFASKESMPLHVIVIGTLAGQIVGTVHSYFWNKYFTFRSKKKSAAEFFRFVLVYAVQYGVNFGLTTLLDRLIAMPWLVTLLVTLVCTLLSYFGHNFFSFRKKKEPSPDDRGAAVGGEETTGQAAEDGVAVGGAESPARSVEGAASASEEETAAHADEDGTETENGAQTKAQGAQASAVCAAAPTRPQGRVRRLAEKYLRLSRADKMLAAFIGILGACIAVFLVEWVGWAIAKQHVFGLPLFHQNRSDFFMDFFNVIYFVVGGKNPYTSADSLSSYPPFALLIALFFSLFVGDPPKSSAMRVTAGGVSALAIFFILFLAGSYLAFNAICKKQGFARKTRLILTAVFFFSAPMLFLIERANFLLFSLMFVLIFFALYTSEKKWVRELSYLSLAAAFGIKLYPVAFGIVLFKDRRFWAILRLAVYCAALFVLPFFAFEGGISNFSVFLQNLSVFTAFETPFNNYALYQIWFTIRNVFGSYALTEQAVRVCGYISYGVSALCVLAAFLCKKRWQSILAAALFTVYITTPSYLYIGVMLIPPALFFLAEREKSRRDWLAASLFIVVFQPLYLGFIVRSGQIAQNRITVCVFLQSIALLVLVGVCVCGAAGTVLRFLKTRTRGNAEKRTAPAMPEEQEDEPPAQKAAEEQTARIAEEQAACIAEDRQANAAAEKIVGAAKGQAGFIAQDRRANAEDEMLSCAKNKTAPEGGGRKGEGI